MNAEVDILLFSIMILCIDTEFIIFNLFVTLSLQCVLEVSFCNFKFALCFRLILRVGYHFILSQRNVWVPKTVVFFVYSDVIKNLN